MNKGMRGDSRQNAVAERLWYVVKDAIAAGVAPSDFREEVIACWTEAHREMAEFAAHELRQTSVQ